MNSEKTANENQARRSMQEILLALGKRIRSERKGKGFSQEGFAEVCGLHRTEMGLWSAAKRSRDWTRCFSSLSTLAFLPPNYYRRLSHEQEKVESRAG